MFRIAWQCGDDADLAHADHCPECASWARSSEHRRGVLAGLARFSVPAELDERVAREFAGDRSVRLERLLSSLVRLGAPAALDERVAQAFAVRGDEERGRQKAGIVRALEVQSAPSVLERLVNEELAAPERHRVERFPGTLERVSAPPVLAQRLGSVVRRRALTRLVLGPLVTLAAAALVVWFSVGRGPEPRRRRFEVVQATSLQGLDPMARMLAESLSGAPPR